MVFIILNIGHMEKCSNEICRSYKMLTYVIIQYLKNYMLIASLILSEQKECLSVESCQA